MERWHDGAPAQIVRDARDHGVEVRLGLRMVKGLANTDAAKIVTARADDPFASVDDLWRRAGVPAASLVELAEADAFQPSLRLVRREALWAIKALRDERLPLFAAASERKGGRSLWRNLFPMICGNALSAR